MNQFTKVLKKAFNTLSEDIQTAEQPSTDAAIGQIDKALSNNGQLNNDANAKQLRDKLFGNSTDDSTNPLHSAYDKIKQNPENPKLSDGEQQAYNDQHEKMQSTSPTDDETADGSGQNDGNTNSQQTSTNTASTTGSTPASNTGSSQSSHQPNATQYNPMSSS